MIVMTTKLQCTECGTSEELEVQDSFGGRHLPHEELMSISDTINKNSKKFEASISPDDIYVYCTSCKNRRLFSI